MNALQLSPIADAVQQSAQPTQQQNRRPRPQQGNRDHRHAFRAPQVTIPEEIANLAKAEIETFPPWGIVYERIVARVGDMPPQILFDFVLACPREFAENGRNLPLEIVTQYRDNVLNHVAAAQGGLTMAVLEKAASRIRTLLQLGSFYSAVEYLQAYNLVVLMYKEAKGPIHDGVGERMGQCARFHKSAFTPATLVEAGYQKRFNGGAMEYVHPESGDVFPFPKPVGQALVAELEALGYEMKSRTESMGVWMHPETRRQQTVHFPVVREGNVAPDGHKLTGGALLSDEETKKRAVANAALRDNGVQKRRDAAAAKRHAPKQAKRKKGDDADGGKEKQRRN